MSRDPNHGTVSEYNNHGCRCDPCREANREYRRDRKKIRLTSIDRIKRHGTRNEYDQYNCRCDLCVSANAEYVHSWRSRRRSDGYQVGTARVPRGVCEAVGCSNTVLSARADARFCSRRCSGKTNKPSVHPEIEGYSDTGSNWISRTRRLSIYSRDDYTCQLCIKTVTVPFDGKNKRSATLDHIIPRSLWLGTVDNLHADENLRTVCYGCNASRSNKLDDATWATIYILLGVCSSRTREPKTV